MRNTRQINYWTLGGMEGETPIPEVLEQAADMGLDGVELCFGAGHLAPGISQQTCNEYRNIARDLGLKLETLATGFYWGASLSSPRAPERNKAIRFTKEYLQVAKWLGAKTVLVVPGAVAVPFDPSRPVVPYATAWKHATASIRRCLSTAKKRGITMALENVWNWFLTDPIAMKTFVDQFKSARVKVYFDVGNCIINGFPEHWIELLGNRIAAIHLKNFQREDCGGGLHCFGDDLLKGDVDWKAVVRALKKIKYKGPLTAEMVPFSRLPDLGLPDKRLARDTAKKVSRIFAG